MAFDIHPIVIHFPIALLFLYSILKILPLSKWFPQVSWRQIERVLLVIGFAGALVALLTGQVARQLNQPDRTLVHAHETFAQATTWLYGALLLGEIAAFVNERKYVTEPTIAKILELIETVLANRMLSAIIALIALGTLFLTGLLGGALVYGTSADPLTGIILPWLGIPV